MADSTHRVRNLVLVLGDQLDQGLAAFDDFDNARDAVLMMELEDEATYVRQHKQRLVLFFSAMRHFAESLRDKHRHVFYARLDDPDNGGDLQSGLGRWLHRIRPGKLRLCRPGDHRVLSAIRSSLGSAGCALELIEDRHFYAQPDEFRSHAQGRRQIRQEYFYREMRRRHAILLDDEGRPLGGRWNFDAENRRSFGESGPGHIKAPRSFRPDATTREVIRLVGSRFADHPGRLDGFDYPVERRQARQALRDFIDHRLAGFGDYQDAMVRDQPYLYHSRLSCALNLHLLDPRELVEAAVEAYEAGGAPLNSVEGLVRQVLGWREYVHGIYWTQMPGYAACNALQAELPVPASLWTGETEMNCVRQVVGHLQQHAYAHHIQRLMVLGLYCLLLGVRPFEVHRWHMAMYADAIDWVSLPNVLGMSQFADGGLLASKPYAASGRYIDRMSDYCRGCRFRPERAVGDNACPMTTLYWDFLSRHRKRLEENRRMRFQLNNLDRKGKDERRAIRAAAASIQQAVATGAGP